MSSREEILAVNCLKLIKQYSWLLNAFVLDFYTDNHWEKLPCTWREVLSQTSLEELGGWMLMSERNPKRVWPLSLLALRTSANAYSLPREQNNVVESKILSCDNGSVCEGNTSLSGLETKCLMNENLKQLFMRHVKPKKRHETAILAKLCANAARESGVGEIIDVGGGKGHLSRLLAYGYGLNVCCVEAQKDLTISAREIDKKIEYTASKYLGETYVQSLPRPQYIEMTVGCSNEALAHFKEVVLEKLKNYSSNTVVFGIVGLHPCGDLAATLLNIFTNIPQARFICMASCCYMKLSFKRCDVPRGYPLSSFFLTLSEDLTELTYEALEVSCHALEGYCQRLQSSDYKLLKIHSFRAVLEKLILKYYPSLKHIGLRSIKHFDQMDFQFYVQKALAKVDLTIPLSDLTSDETTTQLDQWQNVVIFYSLRLLLAPLVETVVLLDRMLFIQEQGGVGAIIPGFDPVLSPRNLILHGFK